MLCDCVVSCVLMIMVPEVSVARVCISILYALLCLFIINNLCYLTLGQSNHIVHTLATVCTSWTCIYYSMVHDRTAVINEYDKCVIISIHVLSVSSQVSHGIVITYLSMSTRCCLSYHHYLARSCSKLVVQWFIPFLLLMFIATFHLPCHSWPWTKGKRCVDSYTWVWTSGVARAIGLVGLQLRMCNVFTTPTN